MASWDRNNTGLTQKTTSSDSFDKRAYRNQQVDESIKYEREKYDRYEKERLDKWLEKQKKVIDQTFKFEKKLWDQYFNEREKKELETRNKYYKQFLNAIEKANKELDDREQRRRDHEAAAKVVGMTSKERKQAGISDQEYEAAKKTWKSTMDFWGKDGLFDKLTTSLRNALDSQIKEIAGYKSKWDTRLYGSDKSYEGIAWTASKTVGVSPFVQTSKLYQNIDKAIEKGIAMNVEQRAFLETIKDKIATTFDAFDSNLLQLIRVQKADTTAARLGMEAKITELLNDVFQTTEYLSDKFDDVSAGLYEALSQMGSGTGVEVEYQVQKWLGALYSRGMSGSSVSNISQALGQLGSGNVTGLSSGMQNLLVMSANRAGLSYAQLLSQGLTATDTNLLLAKMVEYLSEIAESDNNIVRSQLASVFGLTISDLTAISNLASDYATIANSSLTASGAINNLYSMADSMWQRTSVGEMMSNMWSNVQYGISSNIAANPALYALWNVSNALEDLTGGGSIATVGVLGNFVDLNTDIASLMKFGALGVGLLGSLGNLISGVASGSSGGFSGSAMLKSLGINDSNLTTTVVRGGGTKGLSLSSSGYSAVGNSSGSDIYEASIASANDQKQEAIEAQGEDNEDKLQILTEHVIAIEKNLERVSDGDTLRVRIADWGISSPFASLIDLVK